PQRNAVEEGIEEHLLSAEGILQALRPGRENQPERCRDRDQDDERPQWVALDDPCHRCHSRAVRARTPVSARPAPAGVRRQLVTFDAMSALVLPGCNGASRSASAAILSASRGLDLIASMLSRAGCAGQ